MKKNAKTSRKTLKNVRSIWDIIWEFISDVMRDDVGLYSAQSTFFIVLSAVPSIMIVILCLKHFVVVDLDTVINTINSAFPGQIAQFLANIVTEMFYRSETTVILSTAFITLLWASSRGTMAIYSGLNKIYGYTKKFSWLRMRIMSFFYNILIFATIIASVVILMFGNSIVWLMDREFLLAHYVITVLFKFKFSIFFIVFVLGFAALYTVLPQRKNRYGVQLAGATFTAVAWLLFSYGYSLYVTYFSGYSYIYGSLAALMLLMLWVYFCIYILLIGAEINKHIETGYFRRFGMRIMRIRAKKRKKM